jgi:hypothetical protein
MPRLNETTTQLGWCPVWSSALLLLLAACGDEGMNMAPLTPGPIVSGAGTPAAVSGTSGAATGGASGTSGTTIGGGAGASGAGSSSIGVSGTSAGSTAGASGSAALTAGTSAGSAGASGAAAGAGGEAPATAPDAGAAGEPAGDAAIAEPAPTVPGWMSREDQGKGDGSDVITIGDSWMDYVLGGGGIEAALDRAGTDYRHYGLSATTLLSGQIPGQYTSAKRANPKIATAIMTGGGNDIMFSGSCNTAASCEAAVKELVAAWNKLWTQMAMDGVKDVVLIQYSADAGTAPTNTRPKMVEEAEICKSGKLFCHYLATTDLVMGSLVDGIHPSSAANDRIAAGLLKLMEERKMRR